jgi:sulfotransferase famil protein
MSLELVYVHFPKAAGTSLIQALRSHYGDALFADYMHHPPGDFSHDPGVVPEGVRAVCGHFHADRYAAYRSALRFTFLREPVDNLISIYYFWQKFPSIGYEAHDRFLAERPTIFALAEYPELRTLASQAYFGGVDLGTFDLVGFYERRAEGMAKLSALIGAPLDAGLHVNRTDDEFDQARAELKSDRAAMARLRDILSDDVAFYERAYERFS